MCPYCSPPRRRWIWSRSRTVRLSSGPGRIIQVPRYSVALCIRTAPPPEEGGSRAGQGQSDYHPGQVARGGSFILRYFDSVPVFRIHFPFKRIPVQPKSRYGSGVPNPCFYATLSETTKHFFQQLPLP